MYFDLVFHKTLGTLHNLLNSAQDLVPLLNLRPHRDFNCAAFVPDAAFSVLPGEGLLQHQPNGGFGAIVAVSRKDGTLGDVFEETRLADVVCSHDDDLR